MKMVYINSTVDSDVAPSFIDLVNWIEMISYWDRIIDADILFQHRLSSILSEENTEIGYYQRTGGEYVHSSLETE